MTTDVHKLLGLSDLDIAKDAFDFKTDLARSLDIQVHLRVRKRNAKKCVTTIEGLDHYVDNCDLDIKQLLKHIKTKLCCNGSIVEDGETEKHVIQVTGDKRDEIASMLVEHYGVKKSDIIMHGF